MKNLKKNLQAVNKDLKALSKRTERILKAVDKLEKAQAAKQRKVKAKPKRKAKTTRKVAARKAPARKVARKKVTRKKVARKKAPALTATNRVLDIVKKSRKGVGVPTLIKKTGFEDKKIRNIVFRAFKQGKIKRTGKGIYRAA
jgi:hypothetical protein